MNDKSELLDRLKIDREVKSTPSRRKPLWIGAGVAALAAVAGLFLWLKPAPAVEVHAAVAQAAASSQAGGGASVLDASGYVVARRAATVSAKITGKVAEVLIDEGDHVQEGQVMARLDDSNARAALALSQAQLDSARAALGQLQAQLDDAVRQLRRNRELAAQKLVSQQALDTAQSTMDALKAQLEHAREEVKVAERSVAVAQQNLDDTVVRAPFAGVVTVKAAQVGEIVSPLSAGGGFTRTGIGTIVDMNSLEIEVDVNENFINRVQPSQGATATLNAYPDWKIPCAVIAIIPAADRSKATVKVRVGFKVHDPRILPDMGVRVSFLSEAEPEPQAQAPSGVLVPAEAVLANGDSGVVYVIHGERVERRAVRLGSGDGNNLRVLSGLAAGERVAVGDLAKLADGARVKVIP